MGQHDVMVRSDRARAGYVHALFYGHAHVGIGGTLGAGSGNRSIPDHRVAIAHRQQAAGHEHGQIQHAALHQFLHVDVAAVGSAVAGRFLRIRRRGGDQPHGRIQGQPDAAGQHQFVAVNAHHSGVTFGEFGFQKAPAGHHHVRRVLLGLDADELDTQRVARFRAVDVNRAGCRPLQRLFLQHARLTDALEGVPGFHHQVIAVVNGNGRLVLRLQDVNALLATDGFHRACSCSVVGGNSQRRCGIGAHWH